jgi:hypothetical protein
LAVDLDHDGDADAALATTTQAAGVVERAHLKVFSLRTQANYGRSVASFITAGNTTRAQAVRLAMTNPPRHQQVSMRKTVTHCYEQLAVIEKHLRSARTNATFVKCRGVQPPPSRWRRRISSPPCALAAPEAMSSTRYGCVAKCCD